MQQMPAEIRPNLLDRGIGHQRVKFREKLRLHVVGLARGRGVRGGHVIGQRKVRQLLREGSHVSGVIQVLRVALLSNGQRGLGQAGFEGQHRLRVLGRLRLRLAGQHKHLVHMGHVLLSLLHRFSVGPSVVVALRQTQSSRAVERDNGTGVGKVLIRAHAEEGVHADSVEVRQQRGQLRRRLQHGNAVQLRLQRRKSQPVYRGSVHATRVLIADLLFISGARGRGHRCIFKNLLQAQPVQLSQFGVAAVVSLIGRQRIALEPAVATVAIKVVAGVHGLIDQ